MKSGDVLTDQQVLDIEWTYAHLRCVEILGDNSTHSELALSYISLLIDPARRTLLDQTALELVSE